MAACRTQHYLGHDGTLYVPDCWTSQVILDALHNLHPRWLRVYIGKTGTGIEIDHAAWENEIILWVKFKTE